MRLDTLLLAALCAAEMAFAVAPSLAKASATPPHEDARWVLVATGPTHGASSTGPLTAGACLDAADLVPLDTPGARGLCLDAASGAALTR